MESGELGPGRLADAASADLTIVVVSWNTRELLRGCLASALEATGRMDGEVVVVDNGSSDGTVEMVLSDFPTVRLVENRENRGFAAANNQAIVGSASRYVLLLNSDAVLLPGSAESMVSYLDSHPAVGAVGAQLLNPDGTFQWSYADFPSLVGELLLSAGVARWVLSRAYPSHPPQRSLDAKAVDWVSGACLMVRSAAVDQVGLLDEDYFMYSEETDWCYRLWRGGWPVHYLPTAKAVHWSGRSASKAPEAKRAQLYRSKWLFFAKHRGKRTAKLYLLALRVISGLKLVAWAAIGLVPSRRERATGNVKAYEVLLNQLGAWTWNEPSGDVRDGMVA